MKTGSMDQDKILDSLDWKLTRLSDGLLVSHLYNCLIRACLILEELLRVIVWFLVLLSIAPLVLCVLSLS